MNPAPRMDLNFVRSMEPLPTVEVDIIEAMEKIGEYRTMLAHVLARVAQMQPGLHATIYLYQAPSINFGRQSWSGFFAVAGHPAMAQVILNIFQNSDIDAVRESVPLPPELLTHREIHLENGLAWLPEDASHWYAINAEASTNGIQDFDGPAEDEGLDMHSQGSSDEPAEGDGHAAMAGTVDHPCQHRAGPDASLEQIRARIESTFGLPEGSVRLVGPDGAVAESAPSIAALHELWEAEPALA